MNSTSKGDMPKIPVASDTSDRRISALEKKLEDLKNYFNNCVNELGKRADALNSDMKGVKKDLEKQRDDLLKFMKKVNDLELKLDALLKAGGGQGTTVQASTLDMDKLDELRKALNDLRGDYRNFKNEVMDKFNQVHNELDRKADKEDLEKLKKLLNGRLDDLEKALNKTKGDLKRALRILNDRVSVKLK